MKRLEISNPVALDYRSREALNRLRVNFSFCGDQYKKIIVTSSVPSEGKSFISFNLAMMLAEAGSNVVLVDADIRKSQLRMSLGLKTEDEDPVGILQYLAGRAGVNDIVYSTNYQNLLMVPTFRTVVNPAILFQSDRFPALLNSLAEQLDYVIVDTPPLASVSDGDLIASHCDGAVLIVRSGVTPRTLISSTLRQIESAGCTLMGVVINRANIKSSGYYGKYYGGYYDYYEEGTHSKNKGVKK